MVCALPCTELWSKGQPCECFLFFNVRSENMRAVVPSRGWTQNCGCALNLGRTGANAVLSRAATLMPWVAVEGGDVLMWVSEWDHSQEVHCKSLCPEVPDSERKTDSSSWNLCQALCGQSLWAPQLRKKCSTRVLRHNRVGFSVNTRGKIGVQSLSYDLKILKHNMRSIYWAL